MGNRLELFVDDYLIDAIQGDVQLQLLKPEAQEVVLVTDKPWEGNTSGYFTFFQDGDVYRMIYRGWQHDVQKKAEHQEVTCYAESQDGIHWIKPDLGLCEWQGSKQNNIVWLGPGTHNFTPFRDDNPGTPAESRYKALGGGSDGLLAFASPDCKQWRVMQETLQLEVLDEVGQVIGRSQTLDGQAIDAPVTWEQQPNLQANIVQLRFKLQDADQFSLRFD